RLVAPHGLGHDERHRAALALLLVDVDDAALAQQHVTDHDRPVVVELLLAVEDEATPGEQLPHDLVHRVLAAGRVLRLLFGEPAPELHRERPRGRGRDVVETGSLGRGRVVIDGVLVLDRVGEVRDRTALDDHAVRSRRLPDDARVEGHASRSHLVGAVPRLDGRVNDRDTVTPTSVFNAGRRAQMGLLDGKVAIVTGAGNGVGRGEAIELADQGAKVVVNDLGVSVTGEGADKRTADEVVDVIKSRGGEAIANYDDVADFNGAKN